VPEMYLSGPPLHVLAFHCVDKWRSEFGASIPISFSGGIDQHNFADAVACDLVPVTTCTDLLLPGGYGRLSRYLDNLEEAMEACGATTRAQFIAKRFSHLPLLVGQPTSNELATAAVANTKAVVAKITDDPRYATAT